MKSYKVTIDGVPNTLTPVYTSSAGDVQYNTEGDKSALTFRGMLDQFPKDTPIKTSGITLVILSK